MSRPFPRGAIVVRRGSYAVVWTDSARGLELLAIEQPEHRRAGDVPLDRNLDLLAFSVSLPGAVVRASRKLGKDGDDYAVVGQLSAGHLARVAIGLDRAESTDAIERKWIKPLQ